MDLLQMRYVTAIAQAGSMTQAAKVLHISQSALSLSCKRLEAELGVKLFLRNGRRLELTPDGVMFCEKASEILELTDDLTARLRKQSGWRNHPIVFGSEVIDYSNEMITLYRQISPPLELLAENATREGIADKLYSGEYSFALTLHDMSGNLLESTQILDEPMLLLAGPTSHLIRQETVPMRALSGASLVTTSENYSIGILMRSFFEQSGIRAGAIQLVGDSDSIVVKVFNNFGISFVPETVVNLWKHKPEICIPGIRWIPMEDTFCRRAIYLTRLKQPIVPIPEEILDFLLDYSASVRAQHSYPMLEEFLVSRS